MKVEINTIFVDEERLDEVSSRAREQGIKVLPIGERVELIPGIEVYQLTDNSGIDVDLTEHSSLEIDDKNFDKIYLDDEHKAKSEGQ